MKYFMVLLLSSLMSWSGKNLGDGSVRLVLVGTPLAHVESHGLLHGQAHPAGGFPIPLTCRPVRMRPPARPAVMKGSPTTL